MKIGIITLPLYSNYGGILQNYALQQTLLKLGHSPVTLDRIRERNALRFYLSFFKHLLYKVLHIKTSKIFTYQHTYQTLAFRRFLKTELTLSKKIINYTPSIIESEHLEAIITGSDQVWRRVFHTESDLKNYYFEFIKDSKIIKVAYAVSFGTNAWDYEPDLTQQCKKLIQNFNSVSTREDSGVELCRNYLGYNATPVSDPTLLLSREDYVKLCKNIPEEKEKFILAYILDPDEKREAIINTISAKLNYRIKFVQSELYANLSIENWLALFRDTAYVITDSFHGTVFSIIFNVPFTTIINNGRGTDRFNSILHRFNLSSRIYSDEHLKEFNTAIDWECVNHIKAEWSLKSIEFIKKSLQNK